jgi:hypothetical protein
VHRSCLPIWIANYDAFLKEASGPRPGGQLGRWRVSSAQRRISAEAPQRSATRDSTAQDLSVKSKIRNLEPSAGGDAVRGHFGFLSPRRRFVA